MTDMHTYTIQAGDVVDQVIAPTINKAIQLFRERWDFADGPMPQVEDIAVLSSDDVDPEVWRVYRDGKPVSPGLGDENEASVWLLKHQSMTPDWAIKHEGYEIKRDNPPARQDSAR